MKVVPVLFVIVLCIIISALIIGFRSYVWNSLESIRKKIQPESEEVQQFCKKRQRVFVGGILGFVTVIVAMFFAFPNVRWGYQIALAIVIGLLPGLFIGIATLGERKNKEK